MIFLELFSFFLLLIRKALGVFGTELYYFAVITVIYHPLECASTIYGRVRTTKVEWTLIN